MLIACHSMNIIQNHHKPPRLTVKDRREGMCSPEARVKRYSQHQPRRNQDIDLLRESHDDRLGVVNITRPDTSRTRGRYNTQEIATRISGDNNSDNRISKHIITGHQTPRGSLDDRATGNGKWSCASFPNRTISRSVRFPISVNRPFRTKQKIAWNANVADRR